MFTIEQRDALRDRILQIAEADERVVAGAVVGSLAVDGSGDRFSDLDLTFAITDDVPTTEVLEDWSHAIIDEFSATHLVDLERGPTIYRVFLLPDALQFDLSMTPASQFRPAGPRFRLLFGRTAGETPANASAPTTPAMAGDLFGWGVIYALHARACIGRGRVWQAEHCIDTLRDHGLSLACLRHGLPEVQGRGYDDLPAEILTRFAATHVRSIEPETLRDALAAAVRELLREGEEARLPHVETVAKRLGDLVDLP